MTIPIRGCWAGFEFQGLGVSGLSFRDLGFVWTSAEGIHGLVHCSPCSKTGLIYKFLYFLLGQILSLEGLWLKWIAAAI